MANIKKKRKVERIHVAQGPLSDSCKRKGHFSAAAFCWIKRCNTPNRTMILLAYRPVFQMYSTVHKTRLRGNRTQTHTLVGRGSRRA